MNDFPIFKAGTVFNEFGGICKKSKLIFKHVVLDFPTRLNAMTLDDLATVSGNDNHMSFPAGELLVSIDKPIRVVTKFLGNNAGCLKISNTTKRKSLVNHAYLLMCKALDISPSLSIDVDESNVIKHCGFGSSGAIIGAVCSSINELFGSPIKNLDLITYIASNYGEEIDDNNQEELKLVQCIGGSLSTGLTKGGIQVIAGMATPIMSSEFLGKAVIGIPNDFKPKSALELMKLEEANMNNFVSYGKNYNREIAYKMLNKGLPSLLHGDISVVADMAFEHRFNNGSIKNCSFIHPRVNEIAANIRKLYEYKNCKMLAMSSVGPAFFALVGSSQQEQIVTESFMAENMNTTTVDVCNTSYRVLEKE